MVTRELAYKGRVREGDVRGVGHWGEETEVAECKGGVRSTGSGGCGDHLQYGGGYGCKELFTKPTGEAIITVRGEG